MSFKIDDGLNKLTEGTSPMEQMQMRARGVLPTVGAHEAIAINQPKSGLGRGLSALIGESKSSFVQQDESQSMVAVNKLKPSPYQPRKEFEPEALRELSESISKSGIIQPLTVRPTNVAGEYEIVAGERRWRAAQLINLPTVPVLIRELADKDVMELALVENIQRQDLSPLEEAEAYKRLLNEFDYKQEDLARTVGKSRSHISNLLRLLALPEDVKNMLANGQISMSHARALLGCENPSELARKIVTEGLSVRDIEVISIEDEGKAETKAAKRHAAKKRASRKDSDTVELEKRLTANLGGKVVIKPQGKKGGKLVISYANLEKLDQLIQLLSQVEAPRESEAA